MDPNENNCQQEQDQQPDQEQSVEQEEGPNMAYLPPEILAQIISYLPKQDHSNAALISPSFHSAVQGFRSSQQSLSLVTLRHTTNYLLNKIHQYHSIKSLILHPKFYEGLNRDTAKLLAKKCPLIEELQVMPRRALVFNIAYAEALKARMATCHLKSITLQGPKTKFASQRFQRIADAAPLLDKVTFVMVRCLSKHQIFGPGWDNFSVQIKTLVFKNNNYVLLSGYNLTRMDNLKRLVANCQLFDDVRQVIAQSTSIEVLSLKMSVENLLILQTMTALKELTVNVTNFPHQFLTNGQKNSFVDIFLAIKGPELLKVQFNDPDKFLHCFLPIIADYCPNLVEVGLSRINMDTVHALHNLENLKRLSFYASRMGSKYYTPSFDYFPQWLVTLIRNHISLEEIVFKEARPIPHRKAGQLKKLLDRHKSLHRELIHKKETIADIDHWVC